MRKQDRFECTCSLHQPEDDQCPGCTEHMRLKATGFPDWWWCEDNDAGQRYVHSRQLYEKERFPALRTAQVVNQFDTGGRADGVFVHVSGGLTDLNTKLVELTDVLELLKWLKDHPRRFE